MRSLDDIFHAVFHLVAVVVVEWSSLEHSPLLSSRIALLGIRHLQHHRQALHEEDTTEDVDWLVRKVVGLRVFDDENGVMNRSIMDVDGEILVISQFTLFASYKKGNRPSWLKAAKHEISIPLYEEFCAKLSDSIGKKVGTGEFGADMKVELINDGPVTICMDTKNKE